MEDETRCQTRNSTRSPMCSRLYTRHPLACRHLLHKPSADQALIWPEQGQQRGCPGRKRCTTCAGMRHPEWPGGPRARGSPCP